ncbi:MAG: ATP-binding protein [Candidatus Binataceae bacterium]
MISKGLEELAEADLQDLIRDQVSERKTLDYKRDLPGNSDSDKTEFLADVSSFANTAGGDLIYGIEAPSGVPTGMPGLVIGDLEADKLRLESIVRDGIDPRLPRVDLRDIPLAGGRRALIIRIARSRISPHRVIFKGRGHYYARNSSGKYRLDVDQLREAFTLSETLVDRIRAFRVDRVIAVKADEVPEPINRGPRMVIHLIPLSAFSSAGRADFAGALQTFIQTHLREFKPLAAPYLWDHRVNLDGRVLSGRKARGEPNGRSYTQVYNSGVVEVAVCLPTVKCDGRAFILCRAWAQELRQFLPSLLSNLVKLGVELPLYFFLTFVGLKGYFLIDDFFRSESDGLVEHDDILFPEEVIEKLPIDVDALLFPLLTRLWNAAGSERCHHFDPDHKWLGPS